MAGIPRFVIGLVVFLASSWSLSFVVAPMLTQQGNGAPLDAAAIARFPVAIAIGQGPGTAQPAFAVHTMRTIQAETAKLASYSFLLPAGSNKFIDQDGDPASYTATVISPGRQRIALRAMRGDYTHDVEYEAEDKQAFPLKSSYTGPQMGLPIFVFSILITWIVLRLTRARKRKSPE